jgi:hypothetical protein
MPNVANFLYTHKNENKNDYNTLTKLNDVLVCDYFCHTKK